MKFCAWGSVSIILLASLLSCGGKKVAAVQMPVTVDDRPAPEWKPHALLGYEIVAELPHDPQAFTQGLILHNNQWIESTGGNGQTWLRRVEPATGKVLVQKNLAAEFFGEGVTELQGKIYQLSWKNQQGFVYDAKSLEWLKNFRYQGEGWGLTNDGSSLLMSNGTHKIQFIDPNSFRVQREIAVLWEGQPLLFLNELEFVEGEIFANIWHKDQIVRIDPNDGKVLGFIDLSNIDQKDPRKDAEHVLNGIAYDAVTRNLFVTGKCWSKIYQIRMVEKK